MDTYLADLEKISEVISNSDMCAEAMVAEIGEILTKYDFH